MSTLFDIPPSNQPNPGYLYVAVNTSSLGIKPGKSDTTSTLRERALKYRPEATVIVFQIRCVDHIGWEGRLHAQLRGEAYHGREYYPPTAHVIGTVLSTLESVVSLDPDPARHRHALDVLRRRLADLHVRYADVLAFTESA